MDTKVRASVTKAHCVVINKAVLFFPAHCLCCNLHSLAFSPPSATIISDNVLEITAGFPACVHTFVITCQRGLGILLLHLAKSNCVRQAAAPSWRLTHTWNEKGLWVKTLDVIRRRPWLWSPAYFTCPTCERVSFAWLLSTCLSLSPLKA